LQVFVSSTYRDLRPERQAAVEAILTAGHIPAGMELFTAGDQSQWEVIRRWIDDSDVFLLILGGRYGSVEPESGKSYIQLEYEYAAERSKALFAVVIDEDHAKARAQLHGVEAIEQEYFKELKAFRSSVCSRLVRFWSDHKDIKLAILEKLSEFERRSDLVGWVPGDQAVNTSTLAEQMARLSAENAVLRARSSGGQLFNGLTFEQMYSLLAAIDLSEVREFLEKHEPEFEILEATASLGQQNPSLLAALLGLKDHLLNDLAVTRHSPMWMMVRRLDELGFASATPVAGNAEGLTYRLTETGRAFVVRVGFLGLRNALPPIEAQG